MPITDSTSEGQERENDEQFEQDFAEFAAAKSNPEGTEPEPEIPAAEAAGQDQGKGEDASGSAEGDDPGKQEEPASGEQPPKETDPWEGAPEAARKAHEDQIAGYRRALDAQVHKYNSDLGRQSAYQRQIKELQEKLEEARSKPASTDSAGDTPSGDDIKKAMSTDESWKAFSDQYPEIAQAIDARLKPTEARMNEAEAKTERAVEATDKLSREDNMKEVLAAHADFFQVVRHPVFGQWLDQQSTATQEKADSEDPSDAISLVDQFKGWVGRQTRTPAGQPAGEQAPSGEGAQDTQPSGQDKASEADQLKARREKRLEQAASPTPSTASSTDAVPSDDFDAAFDAFARRKTAQQRASG